MLLDLFSLTAFNSLSVFCAFSVLTIIVMGGISFLVQSIWSSIGFLYFHGHLFLLVRGVFFYNFVEHITDPLSLESSLSFIAVILRFVLLIVSWISCMFWVRCFFFVICIFFDCCQLCS